MGCKHRYEAFEGMAQVCNDCEGMKSNAFEAAKAFVAAERELITGVAESKVKTLDELRALTKARADAYQELEKLVDACAKDKVE